MGMKKLARKRLYDVEKQGKNVISTIGAASNMVPAITSASQHRMGYQVITDIVVDLGTAKTTVKTGGATTGFPVGTVNVAGTAQPAYLAKLDPAVFGTVVNVEAICLEVPSDGLLEGANSYKLIIGDDDGVIGGAIGNPKTIGSDMNAIGDTKGEHSVSSVSGGGFAASAGGLLANGYVYIAGGSIAGDDHATKATATITVGTDVVIATIIDEVTRIDLTDATGTVRSYLAEGGTSYAGTHSGGDFNFGSATDIDKIAEGIRKAIHGTHSFVATATGPVVTVTQSADGVVGNRTNQYTDAPGYSTDIAITDFTGGQTLGTSTAMTSGKYLIRVEGFMTPADL